MANLDQRVEDGVLREDGIIPRTTGLHEFYPFDGTRSETPIGRNGTIRPPRDLLHRIACVTGFVSVVLCRISPLAVRRPLPYRCMGAALVMESEGPQWCEREWARQFRECLGGLYWGNASVDRSVGLTTSCTGMGPVLALLEVLPTGTLRVLAMLDTAFKGEPFTTSAVNLARQHSKPERLFVDYTAASAGGRHHCETKHESVEMAPASTEDIFVGAFRCTPFLHRHSTRPQMSCFDDLHNPYSLNGSPV